jgi:CheY-like chemotaxis protein
MLQPAFQSPAADLRRPPLLFVIEDDPDLRAAMAEVLVAEGYDVVQAENGKVAFDQLATGLVPDVMLLDLNMPVLGGLEMLAARRHMPILAQVPFVVTTAYPDWVLPRPMGTLLMRKPLQVTELLRVLDALTPPR